MGNSGRLSSSLSRASLRRRSRFAPLHTARLIACAVLPALRCWHSFSQRTPPVPCAFFLLQRCRRVPTDDVRSSLPQVRAQKCFGAVFDETLIAEGLDPLTVIPGVVVFSQRAAALAGWTNGAVELLSPGHSLSRPVPHAGRRHFYTPC